jgi:hypothetical protein
MIFDNGRNWKETETGSSAFFNLIDIPDGGISGKIENSYPISHNKLFVRLYIPGEDVSFTLETEKTGHYTFRGIPDGTYRGEAGMSIAGENEWDWKLYDPFLGPDGKPGRITINGKITPGIDFTFASSGKNPPGPEKSRPTAEIGSAALSLTLYDSTSAMIEKGGVLFLRQLPTEGEFLHPIMVVPFDKPEGTIELEHIPNRSLFVAVELFGKVMEQPGRYLAFISDDFGEPFRIDFASHENWKASVTVYDTNRRIDSVNNRPSASFGLQLLNVNERNGNVCLQSAVSEDAGVDSGYPMLR